MGVDRYRRLSVPQRLEASGAAVYVVVFVLLVLYGRPGLGLGQGFYLAIVLVALAGGPWTGAAAGLLAAVLFGGSELLSGTVTWGTLLRAPLEVRLIAYVVAGIAVGYFAQRGRRMLGESLHVLDDLLGLARRDVATGALNAGGLGARIADRAERRWPFAVLVGDLADPSESALRGTMRTIAGELSSRRRGRACRRQAGRRRGGDVHRVSARARARASRRRASTPAAGRRSAGRSTRRTATTRSRSSARPASGSRRAGRRSARFRRRRS